MLFWPYRVDRRLKSLPFVTIAIIVLNLVVFATEFSNFEGMVAALGFRPNAHGVYTWFTSMFLHADLFHVGGNMYFLWLFGSVVEDAIGRLRYIALYVLGGLVSALLHGLIVAAFMPQYVAVPMVGASGALAAVMGVFAVRFYKTNIRFFWWLYFRAGTLVLSSVWGIGLWGAREFLSGLMAIGGAAGGVANWAHIGGLLLGVFGALALGLGREGEAGYLIEDADSYAAAGLNDIAAAKYRQAEGRGAAATLDDRVTRASIALEAATGPDAGAVTDFKSAFDELVRAARREEAVTLARGVLGSLQRAGADARLLMSVAGLAESQRDHALALDAYRAVTDSFPGTFEAEKAHFRVAHVLLADDRADEADRAWAQFAESYPNSQWLAYADQRFGG